MKEEEILSSESEEKVSATSKSPGSSGGEPDSVDEQSLDTSDAKVKTKKDVGEIDLMEGSTYLLTEEEPVKTLKLYERKTSEGYEGLLITRSNPKQLKKKNPDIEGGLYWLTTVKATDQPSVSGLQELSIMISNFIDEHEKSAIVLDGLEYLVSNNDYSIVLRLVQQIRDKVSTSDAILLIPVNPNALDKKQLTLLKRECNHIS